MKWSLSGQQCISKIQGGINVDRIMIVNAACERTKRGGPDGRALFLRLHFMSQRLHSTYIEDRLREALATMPKDDQAILEFVIRELDNSRSVFFFSGETKKRR